MKAGCIKKISIKSLDAPLILAITFTSHTTVTIKENGPQGLTREVEYPVSSVLVGIHGLVTERKRTEIEEDIASQFCWTSYVCLKLNPSPSLWNLIYSFAEPYLTMTDRPSRYPLQRLKWNRFSRQHESLYGECSEGICFSCWDCLCICLLCGCWYRTYEITLDDLQQPYVMVVDHHARGSFRPRTSSHDEGASMAFPQYYHNLRHPSLRGLDSENYVRRAPNVEVMGVGTNRIPANSPRAPPNSPTISL